MFPKISFLDISRFLTVELFQFWQQRCCGQGPQQGMDVDEEIGHRPGTAHVGRHGASETDDLAITRGY